MGIKGDQVKNVSSAIGSSGNETEYFNDKRLKTAGHGV